MRVINGWKQVGTVLAVYLPILLAWVNTLPIIGQLLFCAIVVCALSIAIEFAYACLIKKRGIDISIGWFGLNIRYR